MDNVFSNALNKLAYKGEKFAVFLPWAELNLIGILFVNKMNLYLSLSVKGKKKIQLAAFYQRQ